MKYEWLKLELSTFAVPQTLPKIRFKVEGNTNNKRLFLDNQPSLLF